MPGYVTAQPGPKWARRLIGKPPVITAWKCGSNPRRVHIPMVLADSPSGALTRQPSVGSNPTSSTHNGRVSSNGKPRDFTPRDCGFEPHHVQTTNCLLICHSIGKKTSPAHIRLYHPRPAARILHKYRRHPYLYPLNIFL